MKLRWYGWTTLVAVLALLFEVYAFAGLGRVPGVGEAVARQARLQSPIMDTYLVAGRYALRYTPFMRGVADGLAASAWQRSFPSIRQEPGLALDHLSGASGGFVHAMVEWLFWVPPVLFLLALVGWFLRPRRISLIRNGR